MYLRDFNNEAHWKTEKTFGVLYYEGWGYYKGRGGRKWLRIASKSISGLSP